ncbi:MAG: hypothetical protein WEF86_02465 [Gemmatimonadota bacterium]
MAGTQRGRRSKSSSEIRRKNVNIDQVKLDRVRALLGSSSETEAIDQALDALLFREDLIDGIAALSGIGGVVDAYEDDREP